MDWKNMNKKQQQNLVRLGLLAILGVGLLLAGGRGQPAEITQQQQSAAVQSGSAAVENEDGGSVANMEQQLAQTLSCVQGAGQVTVQITVNDLGRKEYAKDTQKTERTTSEENGESKQQTTELQENQTVVQHSGTQSGSGALLVEETMPEIRGVLIVATGARQPLVQEQLLQAAATVLQLSTDKIMVLPGQGGNGHG